MNARSARAVVDRASMTDSHIRSAERMKREVSADGGALFKTLARLWPYIWPSDRADLKNRVLLAALLLFGAKLATVAVPFTFKWAVDALSGQGSAPVAADSWLTWAIAAPIAMTLAYGFMRVLMALLTQLRDGVFAKVAMHAVRRLAILTFEHMHRLSLRFHLERKTGGLTRVLERGRNAIETIVRMVILQLIPTIIEVALIVGVLLYQFDWRYVVVILVTVALLHVVHLLRHRMADRHPPPHERQRQRRQHQGDRLAAQLRDREVLRRRRARGAPLRPLDGALRERQREVLRVAERAQRRSGGDLHHRARRDHGDVRLRRVGRRKHHRRLRHDQRHDDPALPAAQFHGHGLSRDQAGDRRHRDHVQHPATPAGNRRPAGRQAACGHRRKYPV